MPLRSKKFLFGLFSAFLSVVIFLAATEGVLRLSGWLFLKSQARKNAHNVSAKTETRLMCIGESTTALGGEHSYPNQLQQLLNERFPSGKISVINQGVPGQGADYILSHVNEWLEQYSPDTAVVMMGINDERHLVSINGRTDKLNFFQKLHVYKLFRLIKSNFNPTGKPDAAVPENKPALNKIDDLRPIIAAEQLLGAKQYYQAEKILLAYWNKNPQDDVYVYLLKKLIFIYEETKQYDKLAGIFKFHLGEHLRSANDYLVGDAIDNVCRDNEGAKAMTSMLSGIIQADLKQPGFYSLIFSCYQKNGQADMAKQYEKEAEALFNSSVDLRIVERYSELIDILRERNIKIIVLGYPRRSILPLQVGLEKSIDTRGIVFIDNKPNFDEALKESSYDELFADRSAVAFGHCTAKGNRLIAEKLADYFTQTLKF